MPETAILPTILLLDPDRAIRLVLTQALGRAGYQARAAGSGAALMAWIEDGEGDLLIGDAAAMAAAPPDSDAPQSNPASNPAGDPTIAATITAMVASMRPDLPILRLGGPQPGPADLPKPFDLAVLLDRVAAMLRPMPGRTGRTPHRPAAALTGVSAAIGELRHAISRLSGSSLPLMLLGEHGCGRSMVARVLHEGAAGRGGPLVAADLAEIPWNEQRLRLAGRSGGPSAAGVPAGTSTGTSTATSAGTPGAGLFARAGFGTLYLAGLDALGPDGQTSLLELLQDRAHPPECRLVVSANADLAALVRGGLFRADLYHRLDTVRLRVPPLRERREDIGPLAAHFWQAAHVGAAAIVTDGARRVFARQDWPGNLDALKAAIGRIAETHPGTVLDEAMALGACQGGAGPGGAGQGEAGQGEAGQGGAGPGGIEAGQPALADVAAPARIGPVEARDRDILPGETLQGAIARHIDHYLAAHDLSIAVEGRLHEEVIAEVERPLITGVLAATGGNQIRAAALLGMNRNTLRKRIRDLGIPTRATRQAVRQGAARTAPTRASTEQTEP